MPKHTRLARAKTKVRSIARKVVSRVKRKINRTPGLEAKGSSRRPRAKEVRRQIDIDVHKHPARESFKSGSVPLEVRQSREAIRRRRR